LLVTGSGRKRVPAKPIFLLQAGLNNELGHRLHATVCPALHVFTHREF
jgi:hypothetical protein